MVVVPGRWVKNLPLIHMLIISYVPDCCAVVSELIFMPVNLATVMGEQTEKQWVEAAALRHACTVSMDNVLLPILTVGSTRQSLIPSCRWSCAGPGYLALTTVYNREKC